MPTRARQAFVFQVLLKLGLYVGKLHRRDFICTYTSSIHIACFVCVVSRRARSSRQWYSWTPIPLHNNRRRFFVHFRTSILSALFFTWKSHLYLLERRFLGRYRVKTVCTVYLSTSQALGPTERRSGALTEASLRWERRVFASLFFSFLFNNVLVSSK